MQDLQKYFRDVKSKIYLNRYLNFIESYATQEKYKSKTESHHILPQSLFPEFSKASWNKVNLTHRQHYLAHYMLAKALGGRMWLPIIRMNDGRKNLNSVLYEHARVQFSKSHSNWHKMKDENGVTNSQKIGQKTKSTKLSNGTYQEISKKSAKTMTTTIEENGLTIAQNRAIKVAKINVANGSLIGKSVKTYTIFDNNHNEMYKVQYIEKFCKENDLPYRAFKTSWRKDGQPIYQSKFGHSFAKNRGYESYIGWYCKNS